MCIRDRYFNANEILAKADESSLDRFMDVFLAGITTIPYFCLLYTSDAADERSSVDLGGRRIIKKKKMIQLMDSSKNYIKYDNIVTDS